MVQNDENACQNMNSPTVGVTLDSIIEKCLDEDIANQCRSEIKALGKAVEYYVQHTVARNETATRCEREKRCHLESQLKDAFNILDNVRGEIEETKQRHVELVTHLKKQRTQLKADKGRLSVELANMNNEVARLQLMSQQIDKIEARIQSLNHNCQHNQHTDQSQVRHISPRMLPNSDRGDLQRELSVSRDVLHQQEANIATLRKSITGIGGTIPADDCTGEDIENGHLGVDVGGFNRIEHPNLSRNVKTGQNVIKPATTDFHLLNAIHSIHSIFSQIDVTKTTGPKAVEKAKHGGFEKRLASRLLQSEQKSIAELNSKMNEHIETLTHVIDSFPQN